MFLFLSSRKVERDKVMERVRAIPRDKLPENRIQIKTWTNKSGTIFVIPNVWYDLDKDEFVRYSQRFGLHVLKKTREKYVMLFDNNSKEHLVSCYKLILQNRTT